MFLAGDFMINNELELLEKLNYLYAKNEFIDMLLYISKYENLIEKKYQMREYGKYVRQLELIILLKLYQVA